MMDAMSNRSKSFKKATRGERGSIRPRFTAVAVIAPVVLGLAGCAGIGGTTYGTGESQEAALLRDVTSGFGIIPDDREKEPIDYSARAGLVLPPDGAPLPAPQKSASALAFANSANWPQDPDMLRMLYQERLSNMTEQDRKEFLAYIRTLPPEQRNAIIKNNSSSAAFARTIEEPDRTKASRAEIAEYERQVQERLALIREQRDLGVKGRKYLTEPPERFTELTPEVEREIALLEAEQAKESRGGLRSLWPF